MNATERILAALQQTDPAQGHNNQDTDAPSPEPDATLRLIAATEQNRAALRRSDAARALDTPGEPVNPEGVAPRDDVAPERQRDRKRLHRVALGFSLVIVGTCV